MAVKTKVRKSRGSLDERLKAHGEKLLHLNDDDFVKETQRRLACIGKTIKKYLNR